MVSNDNNALFAAQPAVGSTGTLTYTPATDANGSATVTLYAQDDGDTANGGSDTSAPQTFTITVDPVNDAPVGGDDTHADVAEDSGDVVFAITTLLANDSKGGGSDEDSQTLTIIDVSSPTGGTVETSGSNVLFKPTLHYFGPASFQYTVQDNGTTDGADEFKTDIVTVSFDITPVAELPNVPTVTTAEDTLSAAFQITPAAADAGSVTHFKISGITGGTLYDSLGASIADDAFITLAQATDLKFLPDTDLNGTEGFGFTVQASLDASGTGISPAAPVTITVSEVNDAPTGSDDDLTLTHKVAEDSGETTIDGALLTGNDSKGGGTDEDTQTLTVTGADNAVGGSVTVVDGDVVFTLAANFFGEASFRYTVTDDGTTAGNPAAKTSTAIVTFTVTPVAEMPSISATETPEETQSSTGLVIAPDAADYDSAAGASSVTHYKITNITGGTVAKSDGSALTGEFITRDEGAAGLKFTPDTDLNGTTGFSFTVQAATSDSGDGLSPGVEASITVTEVNDAPTGTDDTMTRAEDSGPWTIPFAGLTGNDLKGPANESTQNLTITAVSGATNGTVTLDSVNGTVIFEPNADFNGEATFIYTVEDDGTTDAADDFLTDTATVTITITKVNDTPTGMDDTLADVAEDSGPWTIPFANLTGNDSPGPLEGEQSLTITAVSSPTGGTVAIDGTDVIFTPTEHFNGLVSFTYTLEDDGTTDGDPAPLTHTAVASFTVTPVNDAPVAEDGVLTVTVGSNRNGTVTATDVDGDTLTYALVDAPTKGTVTLNADGTFTYRGTSTGTDSFTFRANDGTVDSNTATVTVTIHAVPPPPPDLTISVPTTLTRESSILVSGTTGPNLPVVVNGTTVQADGYGNWSTTVSLVEGENVITASNGSTTKSVTVVRDTTPPPLTLTASPTSTTGETAVLTAVSEEGAVVTIEGQETTSLTVSLSLGSNQFTATATDAAGNVARARVNVVRTPKEVKEIPLPPGGEGRVETEFVTVDVPPMVFSDGVILVVQEFEPSEASKKAETAGEAVIFAQVDAYRMSDRRQIHDLNGLMTLTFPYDPTAVIDPTKLRIYYFDPVGEVWVELGGVVDTEEHTISVQVRHLTLFAAMVPVEEAPTLDPLPEAVAEESLTLTGKTQPGTSVTLMVNGEEQGSVTAGKDGRFTITVTLAEGPNRIYLKGTGALASHEVTVTYRPFPYKDVDGHWALDAILRLHRLNVITIYEGESFLPDAEVTRLEFAVMVARVLNLAPVDEVPGFTDTDSIPVELQAEVSAAVKAGIITGFPDGSFAPDALVTRAQMAVMLTRALKYARLDTAPGNKAFTDAAQIPDWARDGILAASRHGLVTGYPDGSFQSGNSTTRAEAVTMLNRLLKAVSAKE